MVGLYAAKILLSPQSPQAGQKNIVPGKDYRCKATVLAATTVLPGICFWLFSTSPIFSEEELNV